ncbi:hypothetical protein BGZ91_004312 [Linnemannia elongata]|nr:hypothetical protein BGZ91_004312 [Linnemannia elongata]
MSIELLSQPRTHDQIDKRVPPEIWERIFNRLYPSQLTRMSMVNKNFNKIVSSLSVWSHMYSVAFGPKMPLRTLRDRPESKSYMLFMCASSLYVCEECLSRTPCKNLYDNWGRRVDLGPIPALAPMPTSSKGDLKYLGEELNLNWTIRMCPSCRDKQVQEYVVGDDKVTQSRIRWYRMQE